MRSADQSSDRSSSSPESRTGSSFRAWFRGALLATPLVFGAAACDEETPRDKDEIEVTTTPQGGSDSMNPGGSDSDGMDDDGGTTGGDGGSDSDSMGSTSDSGDASDTDAGTTGNDGSTSGGVDTGNEGPCEDVQCGSSEHCIEDGLEAYCEEIYAPGIDQMPNNPEDLVYVYDGKLYVSGSSETQYDSLEFRDDGGDWIDVAKIEGGKYDPESANYSFMLNVPDSEMDKENILEVRGKVDGKSSPISSIYYLRIS